VPIYEYVCQACGRRHELLQKAGARPLRKCPHCAKNRLKKVVSRTAFQLKGTGWYVTDFRDGKSKKKSADKDKPDSSADSAKPDDKPKADTAKDDKKSDSKPAKAAKTGD
jgi:putative FmdB family regulatory protein